MAFPDNVQNFLRAIDPSTALDSQNIQTYQNFIAQGDFAGAQNFLAQMTNGNAMNLNASRYNELVQAIEDIQDFYFGLNGVEDYINDNINAYSNIAIYNNATNYVLGNIVTKNGSYYRCIQANGPATTVVEPTVTSGWESYWELFIQPQEPKQYPIQSTQPTGLVIGDLWFQLLNNWAILTWDGLESLNANNIWTDGYNYYYSIGSTQPSGGAVYYQFELNKNSRTWVHKTWNGITTLLGEYVWDDGTNYYYSNGAEQYVLNKETSTWTVKTWTGLTSFNGNNIWTDGQNIYYTLISSYVLNKETSTWTEKTWLNIDINSGVYIWTDGQNIYYSNENTQLILDKATSTWNRKTWVGLNNFNGNDIWTDGNYIYYSNGTTQYINYEYYS